MDAISLHQRGIHNAVASLGTALTEQQGRLLRKSSEQIIIGYDADGAGQAATLRGLEILQNLGCDIRILQIYGAKDPDEFVTKYGPERFQKCVDNAISLVEYKIKMLKQKLNLENTNDKIKFLNEIAKVLAKVTNNIEREVYIEKISSDYHISKEAIYSEINKLLYKKKDNLKTIETASRVVIKKKEDEEIDEAVKKRESLLIYLLLQYPNQSYLKISNEISPNELKIEINKKILSKLYEELQKGNSNTNNATDWFSDEETINYLTGIMAYDFEITELNKCIDDILYTYRKEKMISERNEIINKLENKDLSTDEIANFEKRLSEIIVKLAKMK